MRRFLSNVASEGDTTKTTSLKVAATADTSDAPKRAALLFTPSLLTYEDIHRAKTSTLGQWIVYSGIMYKLNGPRRDSTEMIAFDMDGTLIATKSGKSFPINESDWRIWDATVKPTLQRLYAENKYLAIISNQVQLKDKKNSKEAFQHKVDSIIEALGVPIDFICAIGEDRFRKPRTGMWEFLCEARGPTAVASVVSTVSGTKSTTAIDTSVVASVAASLDAVEIEESNSTDDEYSPKKRPRISTLPTPPTYTTLPTSTTTIPPPPTTTTTTSSAPLGFTSSLYVGDAAGRVKEGTRSKDHADSDYKLALNLGIDFSTPEKFFHQSTARLHCQLPDPSTVDRTNPLRMVDVVSPTQKLSESFFLSPERRTTNTATTSTTTATTGGDSDNTSKADTSSSTSTVAAEIVLLAAPPACGKSTLARRFEQGGYIRVNQDTLGSIDKCLTAAREALLNRRSVCVDNTNMDAKARARWVQLARERNVEIRAVCLNTTKEVCALLSTYRLVDPCTAPADRRKIERIVINTYFKAPVYPTVAEGFTSVQTVQLDLVPPVDPQAHRLFHMYLK